LIGLGFCADGNSRPADSSLRPLETACSEPAAGHPQSWPPGSPKPMNRFLGRLVAPVPGMNSGATVTGKRSNRVRAMNRADGHFALETCRYTNRIPPWNSSPLRNAGLTANPPRPPKPQPESGVLKLFMHEPLRVFSIVAKGRGGRRAGVRSTGLATHRTRQIWRSIQLSDPPAPPRYADSRARTGGTSRAKPTVLDPARISHPLRSENARGA
jgi:hypothetical protein